MSSDSAATPTGRTATLVLIVAAIGFLFDTYELLMTPLVLAPALSELLGVPRNHPEVLLWVGRVLWITALCGGVFGLLGGWLIDRYGRKSVMIGSIFLYSFSPVLAGLSTTLPMLIFFRCTTFVGVCVEFVAAVTWLSELFADKRKRELVLGWTQAFASVGGLFVTSVSIGITAMVREKQLPALPVGIEDNMAWRYTLMTGLLPAIPIAILLPFVPESSVWLERKKNGALKRPSFGEIFTPALLRTTIVGTVLSACAYAAAFGTLQVTVAQGVAGLPDMKESGDRLEALSARNRVLGKEIQSHPEGSPERATLQKEFNGNLVAAAKINNGTIQPRRERIQFLQELGGLLGRILLAVALMYVASKRVLLWMFQIPALIIIPIVWFWVFPEAPEWFGAGIFLAGAFVVAQFSFFGEYLPKVFPVHLRGTGGAFATNVGGRMVGTSAAFLTTNIIAPMMTLGSNTFEKAAFAAGVTGVLVFAIGFVVTYFMPEPQSEKALEAA